MRILIVSNLFPPVALGGYELECGAVVRHLAERHEVLVLTGEKGAATVPSDAHVRRELPFLHGDAIGSLRAPPAALRGAASARRALQWRPDLVYAWNCVSIPQSALRVLADSGTPLAFRACEHWLRGVFIYDQFLRELLPHERDPARAVWAGACHAWNRLPQLRLEPRRPLRTAISWASHSLQRAAAPPPFIDVSLERVQHPAPPHGELFERIVRAPAAEPEIVFLGRVNAYKGLSVAIEALAKLRASGYLATRLVVIGPEDEGYAKEMRRLATRLGLEDAIRWRGPLTPERSAAALASAHALIMPSIWDEPFGLVAIEAALARVPIVAADVGGVGEGMRDEEHALLFRRGDAAAAAAALARVLGQPADTAARVERARSRAEDFRLGPYLEVQERFVLDALEALSDGPRGTAGARS